jgi:hypothetical protein
MIAGFEFSNPANSENIIPQTTLIDDHHRR